MKPSTTAYALAAQILPLVFASPVHQMRHAEPDVVVHVVTNVDYVTATAEYVVTQWGEASAVEASPSAIMVASTAVEAPVFTTLVTSAAPVHVNSEVDHAHHWHTHSSETSTVSSSTSISLPSPPSTTPTAPQPPTTTSVTPPPPSTTSAPTTTWTPPIATSSPMSVQAPPAAAPSPAISTDAWSAANLEAASINSTNFWRARFGASSVTWNSSLVSMAQRNVDSCIWGDDSAGSNVDGGGIESSTQAIDDWGHESHQYNGTYDNSIGHFTQLVWKETTSIGCAYRNCPADGIDGHAQNHYFACKYYPVGNVFMPGVDSLAENVGSLAA